MRNALQLCLFGGDGFCAPELFVERLPCLGKLLIFEKMKRENTRDYSDTTRDKPLEENPKKRIDVKDVIKNIKRYPSDNTKRDSGGDTF